MSFPSRVTNHKVPGSHYYLVSSQSSRTALRTPVSTSWLLSEPASKLGFVVSHNAELSHSTNSGNNVGSGLFLYLCARAVGAYLEKPAGVGDVVNVVVQVQVAEARLDSRQERGQFRNTVWNYKVCKSRPYEDCEM